MGFPPRVIPSTYHEKRIPGLKPEDLVMRHAEGKVRMAKIPAKARFVLGADTEVWRGGRIYGKPQSMKEAERMIVSLAGREHSVYTGVALLDRKFLRLYLGFSRTRVWFRKLSLGQIRAYFEAVNPLDKAGAYAIQEGPRIVQKIEGSRTNVIGLPRELVDEMFAVIRSSETVLEKEDAADVLTVEMVS